MKIIWTDSAKADVKEIYNYYCIVASKKTAKTIIGKFLSATKSLVKHQEIGRVEENIHLQGKGYRFLVSGSYKIVYRIVDTKTIMIATVFDCRQNPDKLEL